VVKAADIWVSVQPGNKNTDDIPLDLNGCVHPETGGMSVFDNPNHLPKHRKPKWMPGGEGRDTLFEIDSQFLIGGIAIRNSDLKGHCLVEPSLVCPYSVYATAICSTRTNWRKVLCLKP
jgi:hypothetical protein